MRSQFVLLLVILIPIIFILNPGFSWEQLSIHFISRVGDKSTVKVKLAELGFNSEIDYENFRYRQLIISFLLATSELFLLLFLEVPLLKIMLVILSSICGAIFVTEKKLDKEIRLHREHLESDFPAVIEMLTLSLSAGESPLMSMERISRTARGSLSREFARVISEVSEGAPFVEALDSMGRRVNSLLVRRFIDALVIAITRGAPVIDVLHSHAREARDFQRNRILAAASKAEISMMIPVVFLILPISILFALWPSLSNLNLFAQG
jgi:tight adherence protein C